MVYIECGKYFRICDDCGEVREIQRQSYNKLLKKDVHLCLSCCQKGVRNHQYAKPAWNSGLTKDTDDRVKQYGKHGSLTKIGSVPWNKGKSYDELKGEEWSEKFKKKVSSIKKGVPNYKRRYATVRNRSFKAFRTYCKEILYISWKRPILERDDFKCQKCGSRKNLEVHHLSPFRDILRDVSKKLNLNLSKYNEWSVEELNLFREEIIKEHKLEDGITLCKLCHMEEDRFRRRFKDD